MTISNLKDLKRLLQLCREQGVSAIKIDNIEMQLTSAAPVKAQRKQALSDFSSDFPEANMTVPQMQEAAVAEAAAIITDELSLDQLLFYSAGADMDNAQ